MTRAQQAAKQRARDAAYERLEKTAQVFAEAAHAYSEASRARDAALRDASAAGVSRPDMGRALAGPDGEPLSKQRVHVMLQRATATPAPAKKASPRKGSHTLRDAKIVDPAAKYRQP